MNREEQLAIGLGWRKGRKRTLSRWPRYRFGTETSGNVGGAMTEARTSSSYIMMFGWLLLAIMIVLVLVFVVPTVLDAFHSSERASTAQQPDPEQVPVPTGDEPTDGTEVSGEPETPVVLPTATPTAQADSDAGYAFMYLTDDGVPILYSSCVPLTVSLDPDGNPVGGETVVVAAVEQAAELTGLDISYVGLAETGDSEATVKVRWVSSKEDEDLAGTTAGRGGSSYRIGGGESKLVRGNIWLRTDHPDAVGPAENAEVWKGVALHELGHVLGLGHVEDPESLMAPVGQLDLTEGDKHGFDAVGQGRCWEQE